jgi:hypothetical protein
MRTLKTITASLALLAALCPAAARADHAISLSLNTGFVSDPGFDAVAASASLPQGELGYGLRLLELWGGGLWVEGAYAVGGRQSSLFGEQYKTDLLLQTITAGVRYSWPVTDWFVPRLRVLLGGQIARLGLKPGAGEEQGARAWSGAFTVGGLVGFELLVPRRWVPTRVTGGLVVEGGYCYSTPMSFSLAPPPDDKLQQIPVTGALPGSLALGGGQFRVGAVVRF